jgi:hypothetical protein
LDAYLFFLRLIVSLWKEKKIFHSISQVTRLELVISGFHRNIDEICALLGCYTGSNDNPTPTFRDNVPVQSSVVKKSFFSWTSWALKMGPTRCPETSVKDYHSTLCNTPEERRSVENV